MIMGNMDDVTKLLCNETVLAEHLKLSANATVSFNTLQQALCDVNVTVLLHQLQQVWDVSALMEQVRTKFNNYTVKPNRCPQLTSDLSLNGNFDVKIKI